MQQIDEFVIPIEERSIEAYESGWDKAIELGIFNQWTAKMREALGRLNTEMYPPLKEVGFGLRSRGPRPFPVLIESSRRAKNGASAKFRVKALKSDEPDKDEAGSGEAEPESSREVSAKKNGGAVGSKLGAKAAPKAAGGATP